MKNSLLITVALIALYLSGCASTSQPTLSWQERSDAIAKEYTRELSQWVPEFGSELGFTEFDTLGMKLGPNLAANVQKVRRQWLSKIESLIAKTSDPDLLLDLQIFQQVLQRDIKDYELSEQYQILAVELGSEDVFNHLFGLLDSQAPESQHMAAVDRLEFYVRKHPYLVGAKTKIEYDIQRFQKPYYPYRGEIEKYLKDSEQYVSGLAQMLPAKAKKRWEPLLAELKVQVKDYDRFVRTAILPKTRKSPQLPPEVYAHSLKAWGIQESPDWLISTAEKDFAKIMKEYKELARKIAKKNKWKRNDPASVIRQMKKNVIANPKQVKALFENSTLRLKEIINTHQLVTLPARKQRIRLAGEAESRSRPVPHLNIPPLVNNKGELPEFVVPTAANGQLPFNDFSYPEMGLILTAHEARPGHDLQFSRIIENKTTIIRGRFAMNSVNAEGWGLYAEDLVMPYLNDRERFAGMTSLLYRTARMFLDPKVQRNELSKKQVVQFFRKNFDLSESLAQQEFQRYAFNAPGQAASYYYGLKKILDSRKYAQSQLKSAFNMKCFNDSLISYGLVPVDLVRERLVSDCR